MVLRNLTWDDKGQKQSGDLRIEKGTIQQISPSLNAKFKEVIIDLDGHFVYPGLINAHDHLEMNLYGRIGTPPYTNYIDWAKDIYKPHATPVRELERIGIRDRLMWGGFKNLISGATTVVHHNPWRRQLEKNNFPVRVLKKQEWAHSLAFEKSLPTGIKSGVPFVIHAGEGIDEIAREEIPALYEAGLLTADTVIVHGVALDDRGIDLMARTHSSLIWCPASNLFLFNRSAPVSKLRKKVRVTLGTDSTMTGSATLLDEMRVAKDNFPLDAQEIYHMVTSVPAEIFRLPRPVIAIEAIADLFVLPARGKYYETLMKATPADMKLIMVGGIVRLIDADLFSRNTDTRYPFTVLGRKKYTYLNIAALKSSIVNQVGRAILEANPLWCLVETQDA